MNYFWTNHNTSVKESNVHGLCRYAISDIKKDDVIFVAGGNAINNQETTWYKGLLVDKHYVLDLPVGNEFEAYVNHSCNPNVYIDGQIVFRALRDISAGEFLTVDYGTFMLIKKNPIDPCNCGSKKCRGKVTGDDYKSLKLPLSHYAQKELVKSKDLYRVYPELPEIPSHLLSTDINEIYQMGNAFSKDKSGDYWYFTTLVNQEIHDIMQPYFDFKIEVYYQLSGKQLTPHIDKGRDFCYNYTLLPGGPDVRTRWYDNQGLITFEVTAPIKKWHRIQVDVTHDISPIDSHRLSLTLQKAL